MTSENYRTTISIPTNLLAQADALVVKGEVKSRNQLIVDALKNEISKRQNTLIDKAFAGMATDKLYQEEALLISNEFAQADLEVAQGQDL